MMGWCVNRYTKWVSTSVYLMYWVYIYIYMLVIKRIPNGLPNGIPNVSFLNIAWLIVQYVYIYIAHVFFGF